MKYKFTFQSLPEDYPEARRVITELNDEEAARQIFARYADCLDGLDSLAAFDPRTGCYTFAEAGGFPWLTLQKRISI